MVVVVMIVRVVHMVVAMAIEGQRFARTRAEQFGESRVLADRLGPEFSVSVGRTVMHVDPALGLALDIEAIELLEQALAGFDGALMIVSHDPRFVEAVGCEREMVLAL